MERAYAPGPATEHHHSCAHIRGRWDATRTPALVHEPTQWGWRVWITPADDTQPATLHQIGVLTPYATRRQRLSLRWSTRRPARRIRLTPLNRLSVRLSTVGVSAAGLFAGLFALTHGLPTSIVLPAALLAPLLTEHLTGTLDSQAGDHLRSVEGDAACRYLQRLAALHTQLAESAASDERYEVRRAAEIGRHVLWDTACLLQTQDTRQASADLIARERLMVQLADHVAQILGTTPPRTGSDDPPGRKVRPA